MRDGVRPRAPACQRGGFVGSGFVMWMRSHASASSAFPRAVEREGQREVLSVSIARAHGEHNLRGSGSMWWASVSGSGCTASVKKAVDETA